MARILLVWFILLNTSPTHSEDSGAAVSPSPEGDTRMGADAATSGTDITDKELQAMEEKGKIDDLQSTPKKEDPPDEDTTHTNVK